MPDHRETVAVIAGGTQGLGLAMAERLVREGCGRIAVAGLASDLLSDDSGVMTGSVVDFDRNVAGAYPE
jgi:NAD(P)-dependent dehydrogenase (short-subunit alcohol dehydrogenase family)